MAPSEQKGRSYKDGCLNLQHMPSISYPQVSPQKHMLVMGHLFPRRQIARVPAWLGRPVGFLDIKVEMVVVHPRCYQIAVILSSSEVLLIGTSVKFGD